MVLVPLRQKVTDSTVPVPVPQHWVGFSDIWLPLLLEQCNGTGSGLLPSDPVPTSLWFELCSLNRQIDCASHRFLNRMNTIGLIWSLISKVYLGPPPPPPAYKRALLVSQDRRHLFVTPWWTQIVSSLGNILVEPTFFYLSCYLAPPTPLPSAGLFQSKSLYYFHSVLLVPVDLIFTDSLLSFILNLDLSTCFLF